MRFSSMFLNANVKTRAATEKSAWRDGTVAVTNPAGLVWGPHSAGDQLSNPILGGRLVPRFQALLTPSYHLTRTDGAVLRAHRTHGYAPQY